MWSRASSLATSRSCYRNHGVGIAATTSASPQTSKEKGRVTVSCSWSTMGFPFWSVRRHSDPGELHHTTLPWPPVSGSNQHLRTRRGATRPTTFRSWRCPALRNGSKTHPASQILVSTHTSYGVCVANVGTVLCIYVGGHFE